MKHAIMIALLLLFSTARAGEAADRRPGRNQPPLLSIRVARPATLESLLDAPLIHSLGMAGADYNGRLHGMDVRLNSLRTFLRTLDADKATDIGYYLFQKGESVASFSASLSWVWPDGTSPDDADAAARWLEANGAPSGKTIVEMLPAATGRRIAVAADAGAMRQLLDLVAGESESSGAPTPDARIAMNPRPLLGLASLASGVDFRTIAARLRLAIPSRLELEVRDDATPGLRLRLRDLFQNRPEANAVPVPRHAAQDDALAIATIHSPAAWLEAVGLGDNFLHPINMNSGLLAPHSISLTVWRDSDGAPRWLALCPVNNTVNIHNQYLRLMAWIEAMAPSFGAKVDLIDAREERKALRLLTEAGPVCLKIDFPTGNRTGYGYFMAAGDERDFPALADIATDTRSGAPALLEWAIRLDEHDRADAAKELAAALRSFGIAVAHPDMLPNAFAARENGSITAEGADLIIDSPSALPLLALPAIERYMWAVLKNPGGGW